MAAGRESPLETGPTTQRALVVQEARIRLRGKPGELLGLVDVARPVPFEGAFEQATLAMERTGFGYRRQLSFAPLRSARLPITPARGHLSFLKTVPAGGNGRVPVRFQVDPTTPPGTYEAVFDVAGEAQDADLEVLADPRLEIQPGRVSVSGPAGGIATEMLVLVNGGNVPLELDVLGLLVLQEEEQICLSLQRALARVKAEGSESRGRTPGAHHVFLDALVESLAERKTDFGRVRLARPMTLAPGAAEMADVDFHLPRDMIAGRLYRARLKAQGAQLYVAIAAEPGAPAKRERTAAV
jgi:hypothetical protein